MPTLEGRYPRTGGGTHLTSLPRIGYDDSFLFRENDLLLGYTASMTVPMSMGGKTNALLTQALQLPRSEKTRFKWYSDIRENKDTKSATIKF